MSWLKFPRFLAFAAIVIASSTTLQRVSGQAPVIRAEDVDERESPFTDDAVDDSSLVDPIDYSCGCDDLSCLGDCGGNASRTWGNCGLLVVVDQRQSGSRFGHEEPRWYATGQCRYSGRWGNANSVRRQQNCG